MRAVVDIRRYLQIRSSQGPAHTADGQRLLLTSDLTGLPQAWSVPAGGGWPAQVTGGTERIEWVAASPKDPAVAVAGRDIGGNERTQLLRVAIDGSVELPLTADPATIHRFGDFTPDGRCLVYAANDRNGVDFDLYRTDVEGGSRRTLARLAGSQYPGQVTPDGTAVLVVRSRSLMDTDVALVDLATGAVRVLAAGGRNRPGGFDVDGRHLYLAADRDRDHLAAWRVDLATGAWDRFGPAERDVEAVAVRTGSGVLAVNEGGLSRLVPFDPVTLEVADEISVPEGVVTDLTVAPDGRSAAFAFSRSVQPRAVWQADLATGLARPVTPGSTPGVASASFVAPTLTSAPSFDGLPVPLLVYRPPGVPRGPAVISVHGGPESQERPGFNPVYQYLLARGVAVLAPNVRGSTGYGRRYAALDDRGRRHDAIADLDAVGRWAGAHGLGPLAIMGASYGGYMTLSALTAFPDRFAAGVSIVGMADLVTFLEHTGGYRRALREAEYGSLATDRDVLTALSPLHRVDQILAPLLVIHGANDPRVPISEAEQIVAALRMRRAPVEYLRFEDEGHGIVRFHNRVTAYTAVADFLARHLG